MSSEWGMHDNGAQDRAAESARELKKSRPLTERIHTSKCCTNCCTNPPPERPKTTRNAPEPPIFHNNIHKAESFRNRQVIGSSLIVASRFPIVYRQSVHHLLHNCCTLACQPPYRKWGKQQGVSGVNYSFPWEF